MSLKEKAVVKMERGRKATHIECAASFVSMTGSREKKKAWSALSKRAKENIKGIYKYQELIDCVRILKYKCQFKYWVCFHQKKKERVLMSWLK